MRNSLKLQIQIKTLTWLCSFVLVYSVHKSTLIVHSSGFLMSVTKEARIRDLSVAFFVWVSSNVILSKQIAIHLNFVKKNDLILIPLHFKPIMTSSSVPNQFEFEVRIEN